MRVDVFPKMLLWARQRAGIDFGALHHRFPKLDEWEQGTVRPTLKQLESFAKATHVPLGIFFLPEPPQEKMPIPDFRTMASTFFEHPSPDLLETIFLCQQRQEWYRDYEQIHGAVPLDFVGSVTVATDTVQVAKNINRTLSFDVGQRNQAPNWTDALRLFIQQAENQGILVMASGVVGSNNKRKLEPEEFRGFALVDKLAPLIFINVRDSKAAQIFTLAHELAHIWLGESGVSNLQAAGKPDKKIEQWCNQVAAEMLAPMDDFRNTFTSNEHLLTEMQRLARVYKVSTLVILRRILDLGAISKELFWQTWNEELKRLEGLSQRGSAGGDFYRTLDARASKRFVSALVSSTLEGQTLFRDAFRMLGIKKSDTFYQLAERLRATQ